MLITCRSTNFFYTAEHRLQFNGLPRSIYTEQEAKCLVEMEMVSMKLERG